MRRQPTAADHVTEAHARAVDLGALARSNPTAAARAAAARAFNDLGAALLAWCRAAALGPYDARAVGLCVLAGCTAAAVCSDAAAMLAPRPSAVAG